MSAHLLYYMGLKNTEIEILLAKGQNINGRMVEYEKFNGQSFVEILLNTNLRTV
jgi:hypothetical protein